MSYNIEIRPLATIEIIDAYNWYQEQRDGLGEEFLEALENFYNSLQRNPFAYSYYEQPVRQGKLSRFPFTVVYEVFESLIVVYSVFMTRQEPGKKKGAIP